jgi:SAM-dependent methyltransferase
LGVFVSDLDRDMEDVIPQEFGPDSTFLFEQMTKVVRGSIPKGSRVLDIAAGLGQDSAALGAAAIAAEPSRRMTDLARFLAHEEDGDLPLWVRTWADPLPFRSDVFDAAFCKGALDHLDAPEAAIAEMARVTRPGGTVVLAVANFASLSCRYTALRERMRLGPAGPETERAHRDVPSDHFTRYDRALLCEQAERWLDIEALRGVSLGWGWGFWRSALWRWFEGRPRL